VIESVAEAQRLAQKRLPRAVYAALLAGLEQGITVDQNVAAFRELGFVPKVATGLQAPREQSTSICGEQISFPVVLSPTGAQGVHPAGEVAVARAGARAGTVIGLSSFASKSIEDVVRENPQTFFQMYWLGTRDRMAALVERAQRAGAKALMITLDYVFAHRRDWGSLPSPARLAEVTIPALVRIYGPEALRKPRWLLDFLRNGGVPRFTCPNLAVEGGPAPTFFAAYVEWMQTSTPTWSDIGWLRKQWEGPFIVKGVTHPHDAQQAAEIGATAVSVSNHGGNNLDGTPASIRLLPAVVEAVGDQIEVLFDGGIRRGSDVVKALALGARAALIGRPYLWGLAAEGQAGVESVLAILRAGIDETLVGLGRGSIHELVADDVVVPEGFPVRASAGRLEVDRPMA
jgi:heme/flavin dehydrogenase (mycofactocin system)